MEFIELVTDAALKLKKLFKNSENRNVALFSMVEYFKGHLDRYEYEDEINEQEAFEEITEKWIDSIVKLKNAKFSEKDILNVLLAATEIFKSADESEDEYEEDEDEYEYDEDDDDDDEEEEEEEDDDDDEEYLLRLR